MSALLDAKNVAFAYRDGTGPGLTGLTFTVAKGECVVLCGASGSGKTTALRLINGLAGNFYPGSASGSLTLAGEDLLQSEQWRRALLVGTVFQEPAAGFFSRQAAGEIAFTGENLGLEHRQLAERVDRLMAHFDLEPLRFRPLDRLSSGQKQKIALAAAQVATPPLLVLDEPTANLDEAATGRLAHLLARLKAEGQSLLIAEHRLGWLMNLADRFYTVENGRLTGQLSRDEMAGLSEERRKALGLRTLRAKNLPDLPPPEGPAPITVHNLAVGYAGKAVQTGLNLSLPPGTITALTGPNGSGKTTLLRTLCALLKPLEGSITLDGKKAAGRTLRRQTWLTPNDLRMEFVTPSVTDEIALGQSPTGENRALAEALMQDLNLWEQKNCHPHTLSGGQKQRLSLACALMSRRPLLLLDEPTSGLDGKNLYRLAEALKKTAARGTALLIATHDAELMEACCTHRLHLSAQ